MSGGKDVIWITGNDMADGGQLSQALSGRERRRRIDARPRLDGRGGFRGAAGAWGRAWGHFKPVERRVCSDSRPSVAIRTVTDAHRSCLGACRSRLGRTAPVRRRRVRIGHPNTCGWAGRRNYGWATRSLAHQGLALERRTNLKLFKHTTHQPEPSLL